MVDREFLRLIIVPPVFRTQRVNLQPERDGKTCKLALYLISRPTTHKHTLTHTQHQPPYIVLWIDFPSRSSYLLRNEFQDCTNVFVSLNFLPCLLSSTLKHPEKKRYGVN